MNTKTDLIIIEQTNKILSHNPQLQSNLLGNCFVYYKQTKEIIIWIEDIFQTMHSVIKRVNIELQFILYIK